MLLMKDLAEIPGIQRIVFTGHDLDSRRGLDVFEHAHIRGNTLVGIGMDIALALTGEKAKYVSAEHVRRDDQDWL